MLNDALKAELKDMLAEKLSAGTVALISGAGGQLLGILYNLVNEGKTDPAVMLKGINTQLSEIKNQIRNLPRATAIYDKYHKSIEGIHEDVDTIIEMLSFNDKPFRKQSYGTYERYLSTLAPKQWETLNTFLTIDTKGSYFTYIDTVLRAAYGVKLNDIYNSETNSEIKFGNSRQSYAWLVSEDILNTLPANFHEYVANQIQIRDSVATAIASITACGQLILKAFQVVADSQSKNEENRVVLESNTLKNVLATLKNPEVKRNFVFTDKRQNPDSIISKVFVPVANAPQYLCGNALTVYNAIVDKEKKQKFQIKNVARRKYLALSGPEGLNAYNRLMGKCDYWSTEFSYTAEDWNIAFTDIERSIVSISGPDIGQLYMLDIDSTSTNRIWVSPSKGNFQVSVFNIKDACDWKLQLMPVDIKSGKAPFSFTLTNVKEEKALVNRIFVVGSDDVGAYKLDKTDGNHQWDLIPC